MATLLVSALTFAALRVLVDALTWRNGCSEQGGANQAPSYLFLGILLLHHFLPLTLLLPFFILLFCSSVADLRRGYSLQKSVWAWAFRPRLIFTVLMVRLLVVHEIELVPVLELAVLSIVQALATLLKVFVLEASHEVLHAAGRVGLRVLVLLVTAIGFTLILLE